jgi:hypothetical protein
MIFDRTVITPRVKNTAMLNKRKESTRKESGGYKSDHPKRYVIRATEKVMV